jgi:hypothetical protein
VGGLNENPINHKKHTLTLQCLTLATSDNNSFPTYIVPTTDVGTSLPMIIYLFIYLKTRGSTISN